MDRAEARPILVVDDDETIRGAVEALLLDEGYRVVLANNGKEALERIEQIVPRLVLLDMKMPVMDGWSFVAAYREAPGPHAPIIVMTASRDSGRCAAEIDADAYLAKPFDLDELMDLVRQYAPAAEDG